MHDSFKETLKEECNMTRTKKNEENTKIKLVLPLLKKGLQYTDDQLDFEYNVKNKRADIAILINDKLSTIIEVKAEDENLDRHIEQAIDYGTEKQIEFVALTNGTEFRIYATFARGVVTYANRLIDKFSILNPKKPPLKLQRMFNKTACSDFSELKKLKSKLRPMVTEDDLTKILKKSTDDLFYILLPQFEERYKQDNIFKKKIDLWATNVKLDINDKKLIKKLCKEGAYSLINRVLFYRICEDRNNDVPKISEASLKQWYTQWRKMVEEPPSTQLGNLFKKTASEGFAQFYESPLFNSITFDDVKWDQKIILCVLNRFAIIDFKKINNDLIGRAYENHIPEEERKNLGQFYTPQFIVEYLVKQLELSSESKILDPACGSGAFLTSVLDTLIQKTGTTPSLAIDKNIYGIDINPFANQLTTMNLLLKTLGCRKKPKKINILSADSLLDKEISGEALFLSDEFGSESKKNVRELNQFFDSGKKVFDAVIGNPPYRCFGLRSNQAMKKHYQSYLKNRWVNSAEYKISYYPLFIERSIELLKEHGILAFILPDSFLAGKFFSRIRKYILNTCKVQEIVFCKDDFWERAVGYPTLLILKRESSNSEREKNKITVKLADTSSHIKTNKFKKHKIVQKTFQISSLNRFELYFDKYSKELVEKMRKNSDGILKDIVTGYSGTIAAAGYNKEDIIANTKINSFYQKGLLSGSEITSYKVQYNNGWIKIDSKMLRSGYDPEVMERPKVLVRQTADTLIAAVDKNNLYHLNIIHSFYTKNNKAPFEWIALLLNSSIMNRFYHIVSMEVGRAMAQTDIDQIERLPFIEPSSTIKEEAKKLYRVLSNSSVNSANYKSAKNKAETVIANEYKINEELTKIAIRTVESKQLASISSIEAKLKKVEEIEKREAKKQRGLKKT